MNDLIDAQVEKFKKDFMEGNFKKDISPDSEKQYHDELEEIDHVAFENYLNTDFFKKFSLRRI